MTTQALQQTIGQNVQALRAKAGLSQAKLAGRVHLSRAELAEIEAGEVAPLLETVAALAEALDVEAAELLSRHIETSVDNRSIQGMENPDLISATDAAPILGVTMAMVCYYIKTGQLEAQRFGRMWMINRRTLAQFQSAPRRSPGRPRKKSASTP